MNRSNVFYCLGVRCCQCVALMANPACGLVVTLVWTVIWIIGISIYYIWVIINFFKDSNDCKDDATVLWVGVLIIVIEGFAFLSILAIILLGVICCLP